MHGLLRDEGCSAPIATWVLWQITTSARR